MNKEIIEKLKKLANKAYKKDEVPVSAVITINDKIIASAINNRESKNDILGHAETRVIRKASKKLKTWKLDELVLYTSLQPCKMCTEIIKASRIKKVYYFSKSFKEINHKTSLSFKENEYFGNLLKKFFKNKRN